MQNREVQSLWNALGMWPKLWLGCTTLPRLCAETRCSQHVLFCLCGICHPGSTAGLFFPTDEVNPKCTSLCPKSDAFKFFSTSL